MYKVNKGFQFFKVYCQTRKLFWGNWLMSWNYFDYYNRAAGSVINWKIHLSAFLNHCLGGGLGSHCCIMFLKTISLAIDQRQLGSSRDHLEYVLWLGGLTTQGSHLQEDVRVSRGAALPWDSTNGRGMLSKSMISGRKKKT